jgi:predicted transposase YbfD/YdcC
VDRSFRLWYVSGVADESIELKVRLITEAETGWYNALMAEHHSLGAAASGRVLRYVAEAGGEPVALGTFGSAAWRVPVRDSWLGWSDEQRAARLERVCANQRLCVLPAAAGVPHAASRALAGMLRRLPGDYQQAFGTRLVLAESFTDPATHAGTVYKACGFAAAGQTAGYGRSRGAKRYEFHGRPKTCWLYELVPGGAAALKAGFDAPVLTGRRAPDFNALRVEGDGGLLEHLAQVTDHRKPKGVRHQLAAILAVIVVARLSGADSVYAAAQFAASMPQEALRRCGIRYNQRLGRYVPPSFKTIKRAVRKVDAAAADERMCAWLRAEAAAGRLNWRHIAIDGKTVRGAVRPDGTRPHLLAAWDVSAGTVLGQDEVDGKTNEITCFVPLLNAILTHPRHNDRSDSDDGNDASGHGDSDSSGESAGSSEGEGEGEGEGELVVVTADALHTQAGHVEAMNALGIGWILILKDNQPGLYAAASAHPWEDEPVLHATAETGHGRHEVRTIRVTSMVPDKIRQRLPGADQLMLIERYRHPVAGRAAAAACRAVTAGGDGDDLGLTACAAASGAKMSCETVLAVTALTPAQAGPEFLLARNRDHWAIENGLHYRRDVGLGEDASRLRAGQSPRLFAAAGNVVTSVLNRAGYRNHAAARRALAWDRTGLTALTLLGL